VTTGSDLLSLVLDGVDVVRIGTECVKARGNVWKHFDDLVVEVEVWVGVE
jgi:hypothetical protein